MYTGLCNRVEPLRMDMYPLHSCEVVTYPPQQILIKSVGRVSCSWLGIHHELGSDQKRPLITFLYGLLQAGDWSSSSSLRTLRMTLPSSIGAPT